MKNINLKNKKILIIISIILLALIISYFVINKIMINNLENEIDRLIKVSEKNCILEVNSDKDITEVYNFENGKTSLKELSNKKFNLSGMIALNNNCEATLVLTNKKNSFVKKTVDEDVKVLKSYETPTTYDYFENGTIVYFNPQTGNICKKEDSISKNGVKTGCMVWYSFNDDGILNDKINLLLAHNTTTKVSFNDEKDASLGPTVLLSALDTDTSNWLGVATRSDSYIVKNSKYSYTINYEGYRARLISAEEIAKITNNSSFKWVDSTHLTWFYFDTNSQEKITSNTNISKYNYLFNNTNGCDLYGCTKTDNSSYGYWTSTGTSDTVKYAFSVTRNGSMNSIFVDDNTFRGLRPVITVLKTDIK